MVLMPLRRTLDGSWMHVRAGMGERATGSAPAPFPPYARRPVAAVGCWQLPAPAAGTCPRPFVAIGTPLDGDTVCWCACTHSWYCRWGCSSRRSGPVLLCPAVREIPVPVAVALTCGRDERTRALSRSSSASRTMDARSRTRCARTRTDLRVANMGCMGRSLCRRGWPGMTMALASCSLGWSTRQGCRVRLMESFIARRLTSGRRAPVNHGSGV